MAKGLCVSCYAKYNRSLPDSNYQRTRQERLLAAREWRKIPENQEKVRRYLQLPTTRARVYASGTGCSYDEALSFFLMTKRLCWLCGADGASHLDHDHDNYTIRGWVHTDCNWIEGMVRKSRRPYRLLQTLRELLND